MQTCIQKGLTQLVTLSFVKLSSDTSELCWHKVKTYKESEVIQINTCLSTKMYVFKTGITMHLVQHSKLFKDHLCEFTLNGRTNRELKRLGIKN